MFTAIVATSRNLVIGVDGKIPWHIPEDLKRFKELTTNHVVIMGRKTWDSLPKKPLPNRYNLVISNTLQSLPYENTQVIRSAYQALYMAESIPFFNTDEIFVIGGERVYQDFLHHCSKVYLTMVKQYIPTTGKESFFPKLLATDWKLDAIERSSEGSRVHSKPYEYEFCTFLNRRFHEKLPKNYS